jgi:histone deacetylase 1/2
MENANSHEYLDKIKTAVIENLKKTIPVPSVQMQDVPRKGLGMTDEEEAELDDLDEDENKDVRMSQRQWEKSVARQDEFEESDDEDMGRSNGVNYDGPPRRSIMDYQNPNADYEFDSNVQSPSRPASPAQNGASEAAPEAEQTGEATMVDADATEAADKDDGAASAPKVDKDGDVEMDESAATIAADVTMKSETAETAMPASNVPQADTKSSSDSAAQADDGAKGQETDEKAAAGSPAKEADAKSPGAKEAKAAE